MLEHTRVELDLLPEGYDGRIWKTAPDRRPRTAHRHAELEFNLVVRGGGAYVLNDRRYELRPGALVWLFPWQDHLLLTSEGLEMWVVVARAGLVQADAASVDADFCCRVLDGTEAVELERLLDQVARRPEDADLFNAGLDYVVKRAWRASEQAGPAARAAIHPAVSRALLLLHREDAPATLEELAAACAVAPSHLSRLLVRDTGLGLVAWRDRIRLERFHTLQAQGRTLLAAALDAGFGSYAQFYRAHRKATGASPRAARIRESSIL